MVRSSDSWSAKLFRDPNKEESISAQPHFGPFFIRFRARFGSGLGLSTVGAGAGLRPVPPQSFLPRKIAPD